MQTIIVNATALVSGGALSILRQFIENTDNNIYHIFVSKAVDLDCAILSSSNVNFWFIPPHNALMRIYWDFWGIKNFAEQHGIKYKTIVSLQNTTIASAATKQIVYIHQGIPFHERKWSFFKKNERRYAFYKYIYPWFIFANADENTEFVVQTEWMKTALINKFHVRKEKVHNIKPDFIKWKLNCLYKKDNMSSSFDIFYPATGEIFKNHKIIFYALNYLYENEISINNVKVYLTFDESQYPHIIDLFEKYPHLKENIIFTGKLAYQKVTELYERADLIIFPSQIESFGLPLLEAAYAGRKIIALSTPFAHEILKDYQGCCYIPDDGDEWGRALADAIIKPRQTYPSFNPNFSNGWEDFFKLINNEI
ncbi:Glycosyltransferase Gtf1 [compost metagenome]